MAANFKIRFCRYKDSLHLKLTGNFDGGSAFELLNFLKKKCKDNLKVVIHTDCLRHIHPFGRSVFHNNLHLLGPQPLRLTLAGANAVELIPSGGASRGRQLVAVAQDDADLAWND